MFRRFGFPAIQSNPKFEDQEFIVVPRPEDNPVDPVPEFRECGDKEKSDSKISRGIIYR
jgi:hypothetical protein